MRKSILLFCLSCYFVSCEEEKYPGYSEAEKGVYYKLHEPGESGKKAGEDDYYEIIMQNSLGGKIFYDSRFQTGSGSLFVQSSTSPYFSVLAEGDSATFLLPGGDLKMPGTPDTGMIEMHVRVLKIISSDDYSKIDLISDADADEQLMIGRYLASIGKKVNADTNGMFFIEERSGNGNVPAYGKNVTISYKGCFLTGRSFDDSHAAGSPFVFTYGAEGQVIDGIKYALRRMKAGGKAKLILPSGLAFGSVGSSTGIVPPHTPVVYELELVSAE